MALAILATVYFGIAALASIAFVGLQLLSGTANPDPHFKRDMVLAVLAGLVWPAMIVYFVWEMVTDK